MAEPTTTELLSKAIKCTQELRASVSHVFENLNNGIKDIKSGDAKDKEFISDITQNLNDVVRDYTEMEAVAAKVQSTGVPPNLGNSATIMLDPVLDKTPLYSKLLHTYKWSNKTHEYAALAYQLIHHNSLKRSHTSTLVSTKRPRRAQGTSHAVPSQHVDSLILSLGKLFAPMKVETSRPFGEPAVLHITLGNTLRAVIVLRSLLIEWVSVMAHTETFLDDKDKINIWSRSKYAVFQKVTDHANAAMLHFHSPYIPEIAIKSFITWLNSYQNLFSAPCHKCGRILRDNLPPTWRDFRSLETYHDTCKP